MRVKAANGLARILKAESIPWEGVPILMMGEERFVVAVADAFSRATCGKQVGVCTVMANLNAAGIQMAYGAIAQAWEDSSPLLVIAEGVGQGASRHTHYDMAEAFRSVTKWVGKIDRADLIADSGNTRDQTRPAFLEFICSHHPVRGGWVRPAPSGH